MLTAAINETVPSQSSHGQVVDTKANTEEFDLAMAAMLLLLLPGPSVRQQPQNESWGGKPSSTETASLELVAPLLPGGVKEDVAVHNPVVGLQGLNLPASATVNDAGKDIEQIPSNLSMTAQNNGQMNLAKSGTSLSGNVVPLVAQDQQTVLNSAITITGESLLQLPMSAQNNSQMNLAASGTSLSGSVVPLVQTTNKSSPQTDATLAQSQATALNTAITITGEPLPLLSTTAQNNGQMTLVMSSTSLSGSVVPLVQTTSKSSPQTDATVAQNQATALNPAITITGEPLPQLSTTAHNNGQMTLEKNGFDQKTFVADEMVQPVGKESGVNNENTEALKTCSPDKVGELKSGLGTDFGGTIDNSPQPNAAPDKTILSAANLAGSSKSVALPDLKDRLVQEIKSVLATGKGEQQRQFQLKLEPEHLGQLTIQLFFNRDELSAHFYTGNNHVKELLEGSLQQLRDSLSQQALRLNEALVFAGDGGRGGGMGRSFEERNGQAWSTHNGYNNRTYAEAQVEPVNLLTVATDSSRVNYLI